MKKKIFAICGSTRQHSTNHALLKAIAVLYEEVLDLTIFDGIAALPHFNPDEKEADVSNKVVAFRQQIREAAGVLICTPEYAHGVPGALKNAIDWTVSSNEFSQKPTALITAATDGRFGHNALLETLEVIEAKNIAQLQLLIQFAGTKISSGYVIINEETLAQVNRLMQHFLQTIHENMEGRIAV